MCSKERLMKAMMEFTLFDIEKMWDLKVSLGSFDRHFT